MLRNTHSATHVTSRRRFVIGTAAVTSFRSSVVILLDGLFSPAFAAPPCQERWAHCVNCNLLFFDGYKDKGRCPAAGTPSNQPHKAEQRSSGDIKPYYLAYDDSTGPGQGDWRYCTKCKTLFFNGYPEKGSCAGDGKGHNAAGYNFFLYHDRSQRVHEERGWRFCDKCYSLFLAVTRANQAGCPADGKGHRAAGYQFLVGQRGQCIDEPCSKPACR